MPIRTSPNGALRIPFYMNMKLVLWIQTQFGANKRESFSLTQFFNFEQMPVL